MKAKFATALLTIIFCGILVAVSWRIISPQQGSGRSIANVKEEAIPDRIRTAYEYLTAGNKDAAIQIAKPFADEAYPPAENLMGDIYGSREGGQPDYNTALTWYRKAADQGYEIAQVNLGSLYCEGRYVPRDYTECMKWNRKAAENGNPMAQYNLGVEYYNGEAISRDHVEAWKWLAISSQSMAQARNALRQIEEHMTAQELRLAKRRLDIYMASAPPRRNPDIKPTVPAPQLCDVAQLKGRAQEESLEDKEDIADEETAASSAPAQPKQPAQALAAQVEQAKPSAEQKPMQEKMAAILSLAYLHENPKPAAPAVPAAEQTATEQKVAAQAAKVPAAAQKPETEKMAAILSLSYMARPERPGQAPQPPASSAPDLKTVAQAVAIPTPTAVAKQPQKAVPAAKTVPAVAPKPGVSKFNDLATDAVNAAVRAAQKVAAAITKTDSALIGKPRAVVPTAAPAVPPAKPALPVQKAPAAPAAKPAPQPVQPILVASISYIHKPEETAAAPSAMSGIRGTETRYAAQLRDATNKSVSAIKDASIAAPDMPARMEGKFNPHAMENANSPEKQPDSISLRRQQVAALENRISAKPMDAKRQMGVITQDQKAPAISSATAQSPAIAENPAETGPYAKLKKMLAAMLTGSNEQPAAKPAPRSIPPGNKLYIKQVQTVAQSTSAPAALAQPNVKPAKQPRPQPAVTVAQQPKTFREKLKPNGDELVSHAKPAQKKSDRDKNKAQADAAKAEAQKTQQDNRKAQAVASAKLSPRDQKKNEEDSGKNKSPSQEKDKRAHNNATANAGILKPEAKTPAAKTAAAKTESVQPKTKEATAAKPFAELASLPREHASVSRLPYSRQPSTATKPADLKEIAAGLHAQPKISAPQSEIRKTADTQTGKPVGELAKARAAYAQGDYMHSSELAKPLALAGDPGAQELLADLYLAGLAGVQDTQEAYRLYRKAAASSPSAQYKLGMMYYKGDPVDRDYSEAVRYFRKAAIAAYGPAQDKLIDMYDNAAGNVPANPWLKDAAQAGDMRAIMILARAYRKGSAGAKKDEVAALHWYMLAAKGNGKSSAEAREAVNELMRTMTTGQIEKARSGQ